MPVNVNNVGAFGNVAIAEALWGAGVTGIANGPANQITPVFITQGIHGGYHWILVAMTNSGGPNEVAEPTLVTRMYRMAALYSARLKVIIANDKERAMTSIALAAGRLSISAHWKIQPGDIIPAQRADTAGHWEAGSSVAIGQWVGESPTPAQVEAELAHLPALDEPLAMCDVVKDIGSFVGHVAKAAIGMPVAQGVVLVKTLVHHYVEPHKRVAEAILSQVFGDRTRSAPDFPEDKFLDVVCHKLAHPIVTAKMVAWAKDENMRAKMAAVNLASAAVRCPAKTDPEAFASALVRLTNMAASAAVKCNVACGDIAADAVAMAADVKASCAAEDPRVGMVQAQEAVAEWVNARACDLACLAGILAQSVEEASIATMAASNTVLRSKGIERIVRDYAVNVAEGRAIYNNASRWKADQARAGFLVGHGLFGAEPMATLKAETTQAVNQQRA